MHLAKTSDIVVPLDQIRKTFDEDYIEDLAAPRHTCNIGGKCSVPPATAMVGYANDVRPSPPGRPTPRRTPRGGATMPIDGDRRPAGTIPRRPPPPPMARNFMPPHGRKQLKIPGCLI